MARRLNPQFLNDLTDGGALSPLREMVTLDPTLCLELRGHYINVYYRGGNLMKVEQRRDGYAFSFDDQYFADNNSVELPPRDDAPAWLKVAPKLKRAIDEHRPKEEREFQQMLLRVNNFGRIARATDYYVCDIEHQSKQGRFDLVAVHWPTSKRGDAESRRLVLMEMKYGDSDLDGETGIRSHIADVNEFLSQPEDVQAFKQDMVAVFNQKLRLGLIDCGKNLTSFSDCKPMLLLVLANHQPRSSKLRDVLADLPESPHAELCIATASFMGYGLYDQGVHTISQARERFGDYIYSSS